MEVGRASAPSAKAWRMYPVPYSSGSSRNSRGDSREVHSIVTVNAPVLQITSRMNSEIEITQHSMTSEMRSELMQTMIQEMAAAARTRSSNEDNDESDNSDVTHETYISESSWDSYYKRSHRYAPEAHGRFCGTQCAWCDRLIVPAMDMRRIQNEYHPPCALCEKSDYQHVFDKSMALWTLKRFLRCKLSEELGHAVTVAVLISLCGSYSSTIVPLARSHHVYCTLLQKNSPFLRLQIGNHANLRADEAVALAVAIHPTVVLDLILDFLYFAPGSGIQ